MGAPPPPMIPPKKGSGINTDLSNPDLGGLHKGAQVGGGEDSSRTVAVAPPQNSVGGDSAGPGGVAVPGGAAAPGGVTAAQEVGSGVAPQVSGFAGEGSNLAIKAGVELQMGDVAAACESATAAIAENPKDAKAIKIQSLACRAGLASGPKGNVGDGLKQR